MSVGPTVLRENTQSTWYLFFIKNEIEKKVDEFSIMSIKISENYKFLEQFHT